MSASERAAAAEARRLKILARGKDRLSQITLGTPAAAAAAAAEGEATAGAAGGREVAARGEGAAGGEGAET